MDKLDARTLALYWKCAIELPNGKRTYVIGIHENGNVQVAHAFGSQDHWHVSEVKPILRELSSMSEEEAIPLCQMRIQGLRDGDRVKIVEFDMFYKKCKFYIHHDNDPETKVHRFLSFDEWLPEQFQYLLSKHFDLFGLIEKGLAIKQ